MRARSELGSGVGPRAEARTALVWGHVGGEADSVSPSSVREPDTLRPQAFADLAIRVAQLFE